MKIKRFLGLTLALAMAVTGSITAYGNEAGSNVQLYESEFVYYAVEGGNIRFDKSTGAVYDCESSVTAALIPEEIDGVTVQKIGNYAFDNCTNLKTVVLPDTVTSIGISSFEECTALESI